VEPVESGPREVDLVEAGLQDPNFGEGDLRATGLGEANPGDTGLEETVDLGEMVLREGGPGRVGLGEADLVEAGLVDTGLGETDLRGQFDFHPSYLDEEESDIDLGEEDLGEGLRQPVSLWLSSRLGLLTAWRRRSTGSGHACLKAEFLNIYFSCNPRR
jgi:hypothetical protein